MDELDCSACNFDAADRRTKDHEPIPSPANRIDIPRLSVGQLKIMQEIITLSVFVPLQRGT